MTNPLEWPLAALGWAYALAPGPLRRAAGSALGLALRATGFRRKVVLQNLGLYFAAPGAGAGPVPGVAREAAGAALLREAYSHLGHLFLEVLLLFGGGRPLRFHVSRRATLLGQENWRAALAGGKGALFLSSHVGNWEIMSARGGLSGIDLLLVTKHLKPEWLHRAIERGRARSGVKGTYEPRTFRDVLGHLKKGGTVGFVLDQYTGEPVGVRVPFLGVNVGTHSALAVVAKRTGAPVVPVVNHRGPDGRFVVEIQPALEWVSDPDPGREIALNTARYAARIEEHVRAFPGQWLWTHRRFKGELGPIGAGEWEKRVRRAPAPERGSGA